MALDHTHDVGARSWLPSANADGTDFPIQNLPFAVFRRAGSNEAFRSGIAIGDQVLDLAALHASAHLTGAAAQAVAACAQPLLNDFFALGSGAWRALRHAAFALLRENAAPEVVVAVRALLVAQHEVEYTVPARIGDYTDFFTSVHHSANCGRIFRPDAEDPLTPNFKWLPIAYHGRASSIAVSGQEVHRPLGQTCAPGAIVPFLGPCARLDYELEIGIWIGTGNTLGVPIGIDEAEAHVLGISLLNDWSARDVQAWESQPLGPFLAKNFATTISPWIVTLDALAPYRTTWERPASDPQPLPYLESAANRAMGAMDIQLEVALQTPRRSARRLGPARLSRTSFRHQYWSIAQMVAHHTVGGCNLQPGDLLGSGTISGPMPAEAGALIELTSNGRAPLTIGEGDDAERRRFLEDGDTVVLRGWCEKPGHARIGFGENRGTVLAPLSAKTRSTPPGDSPC
ncbi:MAG TPA: fumarylacetoacetase [Variovorax sp.]|nr:fumarylacetoacetase [Variovorax sp.]